jgi:hypothetical protein
MATIANTLSFVWPAACAVAGFAVGYVIGRRSKRWPK